MHARDRHVGNKTRAPQLARECYRKVWVRAFTGSYVAVIAQRPRSLKEGKEHGNVR